MPINAYLKLNCVVCKTSDWIVILQVITGCVKLVSTAAYVPLRFHCCQLLTKLSQDTNTYIPVLPFIVEVSVQEKRKILGITYSFLKMFVEVNSKKY